jgi:hypothetical protein
VQLRHDISVLSTRCGDGADELVAAIAIRIGA